MTMTPSRPLDQRVAVEVMEWKPVMDGKMLQTHEGYDGPNAIGVDLLPKYFSPTTDPMAREQLIKRMHELGWYATLRWGQSYCHADFNRHPGEKGWTTISETDVEMGTALCLAALQAVGEASQ